MKNRSILLIAAIALFVYSCKPKATDTGSDITISPEAGVSYKAGTDVNVNVHYPATVKPDSIVYLIDSVRLSTKKDSSAFSFKTDTMPMGVKVITAKVYQGGKAQDISTNIVLMAAKAPEEMTYKIEKVYPHDTSAYTEGLLYQDGYLYESTGTKGVSDLRKVDLATGKVVQRVKINPKHFGEGSAIVGNKIIMLTWTDKVGYVFDKNTFKLLDTFTNNVGAEGWGMANDGKKLFMDDKTNRIWFLSKDNYRQTGFIDVYDDQKAIDAVNELEYIDGKLYSNVYTTDTILVINPKTGAVLQRVDMKNLYPNAQRPADFDYNNNVLNGIAWDEKGKRLFVTGKKWPHLYQISLVKK
ncbi:MAG: glutaminyl-peptide cyclotransferase [Mucilaginibacter sp.]|nr:glutaminyl-peptide cyclotransferase [Mucilaginibacter sp.]